MKADDPRHGTYAGWQAHWRHNRQACDSCRQAFRTYQRRAENERKLGYVRRVPTEPVRAHLMRLREAGTTVQSIADRSGVGRDTIRTLFTAPRKTMTKDLADAILGVTATPSPHAWVSPIGAVRRVKALGYLGWSYNAIANQAQSLGYTITASGIQQIIDGTRGHVHVATAQAIAAAYEELSMRHAPANRSTSTVRTHARRKGYSPPLAWDNIDDPNETPAGVSEPAGRKQYLDHAAIERRIGGDRSVRVTSDEAREIVRRLYRRGLGAKWIDDNLGIKAERYLKWSEFQSEIGGAA